MENLSDYSNYVTAAYIVAMLSIAGLTLFTLIKYWRLKKMHNEK